MKNEYNSQSLSLAESYKDYFKIGAAVTINDLSGTLWGISDAYTWKDNFPVHGRGMEKYDE